MIQSATITVETLHLMVSIQMCCLTAQQRKNFVDKNIVNEHKIYTIKKWCFPPIHLIETICNLKYHPTHAFFF